MASAAADILGRHSRSTAWCSGVDRFWRVTSNSISSRSRMPPARSMAAIVFSKLGASGFETMASISRRSSAIASSNAPAKRPASNLSHGGTPPYGPVHGAIKGFSETGTTGISRAAGAIVVLAATRAAAGRQTFRMRY
jgi:hypothetical protein